MDIEDIVKYQINRCNISSTDPNLEVFNSNVLVLLDLLPAHKRNEVIDRKDEYGETEKQEIYEKYWCGVPILTSKKIIEVFVCDYHLLFRLVLDAFADSGLTWKIEPELKELGKVPVKQKKPTPYFGDEKNKPY